ncbi:MAG: hypothetical protein WAO00_01325, partial [Chthoniobacterales bacterium]
MRIPGGTLIPDVGGSEGCGGCGFVLLVLFVVFVIIPDKRSMEEAEKKRLQTSWTSVGANSANGNASRIAEGRKLIIGTWRYKNSRVTYNPDGTKIDKYDDGAIAKCFWTFDGDTLVSNVFE